MTVMLNEQPKPLKSYNGETSPEITKKPEIRKPKDEDEEKEDGGFCGGIPFSFMNCFGFESLGGYYSGTGERPGFKGPEQNS
ncbi:hypothetical protein AYI68_g2969 [Smittium mucronatum]|uniref:Uncharacterized protein n=1 Tax=Smittium mucronatum TaxID=133383 RepID=A0A1R0H187_9FUNG|nr:hypothetical protein AYI68_g2969 [Smittium mucronatum]